MGRDPKMGHTDQHLNSMCLICYVVHCWGVHMWGWIVSCAIWPGVMVCPVKLGPRCVAVGICPSFCWMRGHWLVSTLSLLYSTCDSLLTMMTHLGPIRCPVEWLCWYRGWVPGVFLELVSEGSAWFPYVLLWAFDVRAPVYNTTFFVICCPCPWGPFEGFWWCWSLRSVPGYPSCCMSC